MFLRLDLAPGIRLGPGKIRLLELIASEGSISAAARKMKMSYRRAWLLVDDLNAMFREPLVNRATGGRHGGGASLTPRGRRVAQAYRDIERSAMREAAGALRQLRRWSRAGAR